MDTALPPSISPDSLLASLGRADAPLLLDVRRGPRFAEAGRMLPAALRVAPEGIAAFAASQAPARAIAYCVHGHEVSQAAAAALREAGWQAQFLEGGIEGLLAAGAPSIRKRPDLGVAGGTPSRWITRERPKIDRIACPWLVRRFIDARAEFLYVPTAQVLAQAREREAVAYDIPGAPITHDGPLCSFDTLLAAFDLRDPALDALATIVRGADTDRLDLAPQSAGLLAVSLGLSQLHADDHAMLQAALPVYDALYAWCRSARGERHDWNPQAMERAAP